MNDSWKYRYHVFRFYGLFGIWFFLAGTIFIERILQGSWPWKLASLLFLNIAVASLVLIWRGFPFSKKKILRALEEITRDRKEYVTETTVWKFLGENPFLGTNEEKQVAFVGSVLDLLAEEGLILADDMDAGIRKYCAL